MPTAVKKKEAVTSQIPNDAVQPTNSGGWTRRGMMLRAITMPALLNTLPCERIYFRVRGSRITTAARIFHDGPISGCAVNAPKPN